MKRSPRCSSKLRSQARSPLVPFLAFALAGGSGLASPVAGQVEGVAAAQGEGGTAAQNEGAAVAQNEEAAAPDSARLAALRARLSGLDRVRVVSGGQQFLADGPVVSSAGLKLRSTTIRHGFAYQTLPEPRQIPWAEIESIQAQGHTTRNGALLGGVLGTAIGFVIGANQPCQPGSILGGTPGNCGARRVTPILLGAVGGATAGALIARRYESWQPVYP